MLLVPSLLVVAAYYLAIVPLLNALNSQNSAEHYALAQQQLVDAKISALVDQVAVVASVPAVSEALAAEDYAGLEALSTHWQGMFASDVSRFAILPYSDLGHAGMGRFGDILKNNIERDLVSKAVKSEESQADVYMIGDQATLSFAAPVLKTSVAANGGRGALGVVFVEVKQSWLDRLFKEIEPTEKGSAGQFTRLALTLPVPRSIISTSSRSYSEVKADAVVGLESIPVLEIEVAKKQDSLAAPLMGVAIAGACGLLTLIGLSLPGRREAEIIEKVDADADKLTLFIANSLREKVVEPKLNFDSTREMAQSLKRAIERFNTDNQVKGSLKQQVVSEAGIDEAAAAQAPVLEPAEQLELPDQIFRAYDIRGRADEELSDEVVAAIAKAFGASVLDGGDSSIVVGRDGRHSSSRISEQVVQGLQSIGCNVIDIGLVPTPVAYYSAIEVAQGNAMVVTASHNPAEDNGLKFLRAGQALSDKEIQALKEAASANQFASSSGSVDFIDVVDDYVDAIAGDVVFASPVKVVIDCGNGASSEIAPILFAALGAEVIPMYADVDGSFPNRSPATRSADLAALCQEVVSQQAELGIAFDGDADRVVAVTADGKVIKGDHLLMLFAKDVLTRNPGADIVFDVKCSKLLNRLIKSFGGRPVMARSGHSWVKLAMQESDALLGGEFTGHYMFKERWHGFDDGLYAAARLIELLTLEGKSLAEALDGVPTLLGTDEIEIAVDDNEKFDIVKQFAASASLAAYDKSLIDGVRVDVSEGWGLLRASNTGPKLVARFEAEDQQQLEEIVSLFDTTLKQVDPSLSIEL